MRITLKMIAEKTGVSIMAASAALNNTTRTRISNEKREYIKAVAAEMGYFPNVVAQSLSGGKTHMAGVIIDSHCPNSCFQVLRGIEKTAKEKNYRIIVAEVHQSINDVVDLCKVFDSYGIDGIIALAHDYPEQKSFNELCSQFKNIIFWEKNDSECESYVGISCENAFREILTGWCKNKRKNPALVINNTQNNWQLRKRIKTYEKISAELGIIPHIINVDLNPYDENTLPEMQHIFKKYVLSGKTDALLFESDFWALAMIKAASEYKCRVPEDLAIVGWDNNDFCPLLSPPLASISLKFEKQGSAIMEMLINKINKKHVESIEIPADFVCRESGGI